MIGPSIHPSIHASIHSSIHPSIHPSIHQPTKPSSQPVTTEANVFPLLGVGSSTDPSELTLDGADKERRERTNLIIIIVCVVGGALLILVLILIIVILTSRRRRRKQEEEKKKAASAGRTESFQTPRHFGVRSTKSRMNQSISDRFSGLWKKWTVRANDPNDWYNNAGLVFLCLSPAVVYWLPILRQTRASL